MFLGSVGIVQRLEREAVHQPEKAVSKVGNLPDLAGIVRFRVRQDHRRFRLDAALRIQHQAFRRSDGVAFRRVESLGAGRKEHQQAGQQGE